MVTERRNVSIYTNMLISVKPRQYTVNISFVFFMHKISIEPEPVVQNRGYEMFSPGSSNSRVFGMNPKVGAFKSPWVETFSVSKISEHRFVSPCLRTIDICNVNFTSPMDIHIYIYIHIYTQLYLSCVQYRMKLLGRRCKFGCYWFWINGTRSHMAFCVSASSRVFGYICFNASPTPWNILRQCYSILFWPVKSFHG